MAEARERGDPLLGVDAEVKWSTDYSLCMILGNKLRIGPATHCVVSAVGRDEFGLNESTATGHCLQGAGT